MRSFVMSDSSAVGDEAVSRRWSAVGDHDTLFTLSHVLLCRLFVMSDSSAVDDHLSAVAGQPFDVRWSAVGDHDTLLTLTNFLSSILVAM